jgi:hypothetical protein
MKNTERNIEHTASEWHARPRLGQAGCSSKPCGSSTIAPIHISRPQNADSSGEGTRMCLTYSVSAPSPWF